MRKLFVCLVVFAIACPRVWAGGGPDAKQIAKVKKKVAECLEHQRRVTIETYDDRLVQGTISEAGADAFVLGGDGKSTTLEYAEVRKIKWPSEVSRQAKVILGAAVVEGVIFGLAVLLGGLRG